MSVMDEDELREAEARLLPLLIGGVPVTSCGELIAEYWPMYGGDWWQTEGRHVFRLWLLSVSPRANTVRAFLSYMRVLSGFVLYAHETGLDIEIETLFVDRVIDSFVVRGVPPGRADTTRAVYRSRLRAAGEQLLQRPPRRHRSPTWQASRLPQPYTDSEVTTLLALPPVQTTPYLQRFATGWIGLALAGGLRNQEIREISAKDFVDVDGVACVSVGGLRPRTVPLWAPLLPMLRQLASEHPTGPITGNYRPEQREPMSPSRSRLRVPAWAPRPRTERMRATWSTRLLAEGLTIDRFFEYGGFKTYRFEEAALFLPDRTHLAAEDLRRAAGGTP
ncbi:phage integrase family protein [Curtobacterium sp. JUb34]|uniref:tyrosine-type recombinase/integrase n=1 Tax=Curtobacterium sp. JUb34 TaxID=2485109 RepID=UPI000F95C8DC|nr:tyrosine-type recombinase/integrase [Curtobacterium sp. JUb34]ROR28868.1 phage integrase family protein [Curtobacterium sp. JUb34]